MNKRLSAVTIVCVLLLALLPVLSGCSASTAQTNATVYGTGRPEMTAAAKAADEAIAGISKSLDIKVPATIEGGKLSVGSDGAYPPLEYLAKVITADNDKGTLGPVGFEIDLCKAVAKKLGLEVTFSTVDWSGLAGALNTNKVDVVVSGMVTSDALLATLGASDTYLTADLAICTRTGVQLADGSALKDKIVAVQEGSTAQAVVTSTAGVPTPKAYPRIQGAFADLKDGKVDAVVIETPVAEWILRNHAGYAAALTISGTIKTGQGYAFWCKKDRQELLAAIDAALAELRVVPAAAAATTTLAAATPTTGAAATSTTLAATTTTGGVTTTAPASVSTGKSVYQLLCEKWGVTGN